MGNTATTKKGDSTESGEYILSAVLFIVFYIDFRKLMWKVQLFDEFWSRNFVNGVISSVVFILKRKESR